MRRVCSKRGVCCGSPTAAIHTRVCIPSVHTDTSCTGVSNEARSSAQTHRIHVKTWESLPELLRAEWVERRDHTTVWIYAWDESLYYGHGRTQTHASLNMEMSKEEFRKWYIGMYATTTARVFITNYNNGCFCSNYDICRSKFNTHMNSVDYSTSADL